MPDIAAASTTSSSPARIVGALLVRVVVPLWVLAGAAFKLFERDPRNLPGSILSAAKEMNVDLEFVLRLLIGCELFAAGVMLLLPRLARPMAIFMLSCFCAILLGEMYRSATRCGCFGSLPLKPWHMLVIDGSMLLAVILLPYRATRAAPPEAPRASRGWTGTLAGAAVIAAVGMLVAFVTPQRPLIEQTVHEDGVVDADNQGDANTDQPPALPAHINPAPSPLPSTWYTKERPETWTGKPWRELEIFQLMPTWPKNMDEGKRFVVFYSRTCEHCQEMFENDLMLPQAGPVIAVEIPASRTEMTAAAAWPMPPATIVEEFLALPLGTSWLIEAPMVIAIENGVVTCAQEKDHKPCMGLQ